ncbi:MAG: type I secretion system permease/ATPase [Bradyrhizobium sp.]|uniref:type I secretion system permease/ATPase n=1 Tax=Bradyrhizobium sp. TaxID=376 RepID=UPI001C289541|nr:type I secretion system permease/ATPase [Bradyrhizobium sp.]MBU6463049.1 type I secretion system permease/ATPase [Pseudomonadota bacterium]MDE2069249.1 type I secretion system permease/ATPase [Bradyrhizobium sp.]MDE2468541.1 type I secretion system permease/ATPase [Bradyrhizobium sp.]
MTTTTSKTKRPQAPHQDNPFEQGVTALTILSRLHGHSVGPDEVRQHCKGSVFDVSQMLSCGRALGLKLRAHNCDWAGLSRLALPAIAVQRSGGFLLLGQIVEDRVVVADLMSRRPKYMRQEELERIWDGRVVAPAVRKERKDIERGRRVLDSLLDLLLGLLALLPRPDASAAGRLIAAAFGQARTFAERLWQWSQSRSEAATIHQFVPNDEAAAQDPAATESALLSLTILLRCHGIGAEPEQIRHRIGSPRIGITEMLRCAREMDLKARVLSTGWDRLEKTPLPGIAILRDGGFLILGRAASDKVLVHRPAEQRPETMTREEFEAIWSGGLILMARRAGLTDLSRRFDITWFMGAIAKYRRMLAEVLTASLFLQLFALISPLFFQVVIDKVLVHRSLSTLDVLIFGLVAMGLFEAILGGLRTYLFAHTTNRIDVELGARLFQHLISLPIAYFQARRVGDSVARVRELENIRQFITGSALTLVIDLLFTFVFLAVMMYYSPVLTLVAVAAFPLYIGISAGLTPLFRRRLDEKFRRGAENQAFLVESVTGIETLKSMAVEPQMQRRWEEQLAGYVASSFRVVSLNNAASETVQLINKLVAALTLYLGAKLVIGGSLSVGELVAFNMLSARVSAPVLRLASIWQDFHQARLSVDRLGDILNTLPEPTQSPSRAPLPPIRGRITFDHVMFRYRPDGPETLHDVSFNVEPGQVVGIVGSSGSGKSTLTKLVQRLYVPERGRVLVDGIDLTMVDPAWLRRQIGVVLQENVLFNTTIRENIALSDPMMPMERVFAAAQLAGAHDFILALPEGYDTVVGERGSSLSGGQRQRIAVARSLVADPRILIFDEATSALDYESERAIQQNMKQIAARRTVFIIAHRLSTVRTADRIITLEAGRVVEDGTHDELIHSNGRYAKLHFLQAGIHGVR